MPSLEYLVCLILTIGLARELSLIQANMIGQRKISYIASTRLVLMIQGHLVMKKSICDLKIRLMLGDGWFYGQDISMSLPKLLPIRLLTKCVSNFGMIPNILWTLHIV